MNKPNIKDYETNGSMANPYGGWDFQKYSQDLEKYINYLEQKLNEPTDERDTSDAKLNIQRVTRF